MCENGKPVKSCGFTKDLDVDLDVAERLKTLGFGCKFGSVKTKNSKFVKPCSKAFDGIEFFVCELAVAELGNIEFIDWKSFFTQKTHQEKVFLVGPSCYVMVWG